MTHQEANFWRVVKKDPFVPAGRFTKFRRSIGPATVLLIFIMNTFKLPRLKWELNFSNANKASQKFQPNF